MPIGWGEAIGTPKRRAWGGVRSLRAVVNEVNEGLESFPGAPQFRPVYSGTESWLGWGWRLSAARD